jgi:hypothetical protein
MIRRVYRLTESGQSTVESLIDGRGIVIIEQAEVVAKITREQDEPDTEKRCGYNPALQHAPSIGTKFQACQCRG